MAAEKMNNSFTHSFIVGSGGESKSYNDGDEHCGTRVRELQLLTIRAVVDKQARRGRGKKKCESQWELETDFKREDRSFGWINKEPCATRKQPRSVCVPLPLALVILNPFSIVFSFMYLTVIP